ncbi:hypothetical protein F4778DRAFT_713598 [Xylariomycetidae sp. FL2044]|nr:hypothetical protein F4778DRAFT_713598 [Xylariomycetidae sp. FL2044]
MRLSGLGKVPRPFARTQLKSSIRSCISSWHARSLATAVSRPTVSSSPGSLHFSYGEDRHETFKRLSLPNFWLRDNCRCATCVNQDTMQRNFNTFEISEDIHPSHVEATEDGVKIQWSEDSHESFYAWEFLETYLKSNRRDAEPIELEYFGADGGKDSSSPSSWPPSLSNRDITSNEEESIGRLTNLIRRHGFAFVTDVPFDTAEPTQKLLEKIAFIRQTHYGGFYDFIPDLALADTAYTNVALAAHTDTTYFTDPAGLQAFHLLSHHHGSADTITTTSGDAEREGEGRGDEKKEDLGGRSLLVDGFHAARVLRAEDPHAYRVLSRVDLPWHASGNRGVTLAPHRAYPVLELGAGAQVRRVRWNNDDRGVVPFATIRYDRRRRSHDGSSDNNDDDGDDAAPSDWYRAARKWEAILRREALEYWFQLRPGNVLIFDNWRVLHGRSAFTGVRRICGGYINRDDFISRWRNTNYPRDDILKRVIG